MKTLLSTIRWQSWPVAFIYGPLIPWAIWLCLRYRLGPRDILVRVNPAFKHDLGVFSKMERYQLFSNCEYAIPTLVVRTGMEDELLNMHLHLEEYGIEFPLIVKPDCSSLSRGVRKIELYEDLQLFLRDQQVDYLVQPYISDNREFAIYYYRIPGHHGQILDLTERVLPYVTGDGSNSVVDLLERKYQTPGVTESLKFRYVGDLDRVPENGEQVPLSIAARGSQGAIFLDSRHLISPQLERAVDRAAMAPGFFLGKFDFKVRSIEDLISGHGLKLLEVNGITAELNYIYDSRFSYIEAFRAIAGQIEILFRIAHTNRKTPLPIPSILDILINFYKLKQHSLHFDK